MERPPDRPKCKHGESNQCKKCWVEHFAVRKIIIPLVDEFWVNRGNRDLGELLARAYSMGMKHPELVTDEIRKAVKEFLGKHFDKVDLEPEYLLAELDEMKRPPGG